jgi:hypothetical protein
LMPYVKRLIKEEHKALLFFCPLVVYLHRSRKKCKELINLSEEGRFLTI